MQKQKKTQRYMRTPHGMVQNSFFINDRFASERLLNRMFGLIDYTSKEDPHPSLRIATHHYKEPFPFLGEICLNSLAAMDLLNTLVYPILSGYGKFTICVTMLRSTGEEITYTLGTAIPLTYDKDKLIPKNEIYSRIYKLILKNAERYDGFSCVRLQVRVHLDGYKKENVPSLSHDDRYSLLLSIIDKRLNDILPLKAKKIENKVRNYPTFITALKKGSKERSPFIVADLETVLVNKTHIPYAAGLLKVHPGKEIKDYMIETYFSEDYLIHTELNSFKKRSNKVLIDLISRIDKIASKEKKVLTVYFHNLARFDGIFLLKHLVFNHQEKYKIPKLLIRNRMIYEINVYSNSEKLLFRFRDSLHLIPGKLQDLARNLCKHLGNKGSIPYDQINPENLVRKKTMLIEYMKQDILLLGGVMQKAQSIYWDLYGIDIVNKITLSALALNIFRLKYYDDINNWIHIPNRNEDTFIRKAYYGGHADAYKPKGENLYYYDVNSLYPFVMKEYQMPGGKPVWHSNLTNIELDKMCGFIEAYVECPETMNKPFLPYRDMNGILLFPTGKFVGVYYSEELKYARSIGYTVVPISGYLFERMESPFKDFVSDLFSSRLEARNEGNEALSFVYKILMNSLYGRFGINPNSTSCEIHTEEEKMKMIKHPTFKDADPLSMDKELSYKDYDKGNVWLMTFNTELDANHWNPPKNAAVQIAAAITACARIYMYPYISRDDCYYTDTDSVILGKPLPEEMISSKVLGKFKLEHEVSLGYFLAPKAYYLKNKEGEDIIKYKGAAKEQITPEWFKNQLANPERKEKVPVKSNFRIDWKELNLQSKDAFITAGLKLESKRLPVYHGNDWVDTKPKHVIDLSGLDHKMAENLIITQSKEIDRVEKKVKKYPDIYKEVYEKSSQMNEALTHKYNTIVEELTEGTLDDKTNTDEIPNTEEKKDKVPNTEVKKDEVPNTDKKIPP